MKSLGGPALDAQYSQMLNKCGYLPEGSGLYKVSHSIIQSYRFQSGSLRNFSASLNVSPKTSCFQNFAFGYFIGFLRRGGDSS